MFPVFSPAQQTGLPPTPPSASAQILNTVPTFTISVNSAATSPDSYTQHLAFNNVGSFRVDLPADRAVIITLQQDAGEIAALPISPIVASGSELPVRRTEAGKFARITFTLATQAAAIKEIRVRCISKTTPCDFSLHRSAPVPITPDITSSVAFEETLAAADTLRRKQGADSKTASLASYDQAIALAQELNYPFAQCEALYGKGRALLELRRYTESRDTLKLAAELKLSTDDAPLTATAWKALGYSYAYLANLESAIASYDQAARIFKETGDLLNQEILTENMARAHRVLGENELALEELHSALDLARALDDQHGIPASLEELGNIQLSLGDLQDALDAYREALKSLADSPNQTIQAHVLNGLGNVYTLFEQPESAQTAFDQSLALWHEIKDPMGAAYALDGMGFLASTEHDAPAAIRHYQDALDSIKGLNLDRETATIVEEMGEAYESAGEHNKAREAFLRALDLAAKLHLRAVEADCLRGLGESAMSTGDLESADALLTQAGVAYLAAGDIQKQAILLADQARLARAQGHLEDALKKIDAAIERIESSRKSIRNLDNRSSYFSGQRDYYDFQVSLLMQLHARDPAAGYATQALEASEHARARALIDSLHEGGISPNSNAGDNSGTQPNQTLELLAQRRALDDKIEAKVDAQAEDQTDQRDNQPAGSNSPTAAQDREQLSSLREQRDQIDRRLRGAAPGYAAILQAETVSAASISHDLLDPDTILLEYWLGAERSYLWAVTTGGVEVFELPPAKVIDRDARALYENWTARNFAPAGETMVSRDHRIRKADYLASLHAAALSQTILGPAAKPIGEHSRIAIAAEGALLSLPFAALPVPARSASAPHSKPQLLLDTHELVYLPSASVLPQLRRNQRSAQATRVALFADPVFSPSDTRLRVHHDPVALASTRTARTSHETPSLPGTAPESGVASYNFERLPYSRLEAVSIGRLVGKDDLWESLDFDADRDRVRTANWSDYSIVHFSTHAVLNNLHPELSSIVLSLVLPDGAPRDGLLRVQDIYSLHMPADLVVLSACQTGLGKEVRGEGLIGLTRAFFYAGSQRVMASLWDVNDRGTAEIMASFYEDLLHRGMSPSAALAASQRKMARAPQWSAPYFWAPFVLNGEWRSPTHLAELRK
jgi:CHAT domain-containing protein/Tfp pilus assembly protein PilF